MVLKLELGELYFYANGCKKYYLFEDLIGQYFQIPTTAEKPEFEVEIRIKEKEKQQ